MLCPFRGALGTRLIQCCLRRCLLPYKVASSSIQPFGHNSVGCHSPHRNISTNYYLIRAAIWPQQIWTENLGGRLCPFRGGGAGSPPNTMWPGPRPTCMPSFILIRPTIWLQCTNVTDRQDRTGRQRIDSISPKLLTV